MDASDRTRFITAYSRLVADVWADPEKERQLVADPAGADLGAGA
jgi:hypothetical protein